MAEKFEFNIYSDTFRGARFVCDMLEQLLKASRVKHNLTKRADKFTLEIDSVKLDFIPLPKNHNETN